MNKRQYIAAISQCTLQFHLKREFKEENLSFSHLILYINIKIYSFSFSLYAIACYIHIKNIRNR